MDGKCFKTIGSQTRLNEQKRREWNRKIFSLCWIASLVMLGVEFFCFCFISQMKNAAGLNICIFLLCVRARYSFWRSECFSFYFRVF